MPVSDYTPLLSEVGSLVRSRTTDEGGNEIGTFNESTSPTDKQVLENIQDVVNELYTRFGADIPDAPNTVDKSVLRKAAKRVAAYGAAALVELTHFPEQVTTGRSPYQAYDARYQAGIKSVMKAIGEVESGATPGADSNTSTALYDGFPQDAGGFVGWGTNW